MNPWTVIGWIALAGIGAATLLVALFTWDTMLQPWLLATAQHYKSRKTPPAAGQVWMQGKTHLTITRIADNGRICMTTQMVMRDGRRLGNGASWSDAPDEWQQRVKGRKLWLLTQELP